MKFLFYFILTASLFVSSNQNLFAAATPTASPTPSPAFWRVVDDVRNLSKSPTLISQNIETCDYRLRIKWHSGTIMFESIYNLGFRVTNPNRWRPGSPGEKPPVANYIGEDLINTSLYFPVDDGMVPPAGSLPQGMSVNTNGFDPASKKYWEVAVHVTASVLLYPPKPNTFSLNLASWGPASNGSTTRVKKSAPVEFNSAIQTLSPGLNYSNGQFGYHAIWLEEHC